MLRHVAVAEMSRVSILALLLYCNSGPSFVSPSRVRLMHCTLRFSVIQKKSLSLDPQGALMVALLQNRWQQPFIKGQWLLSCFWVYEWDRCVDGISITCWNNTAACSSIRWQSTQQCGIKILCSNITIKETSCDDSLYRALWNSMVWHAVFSPLCQTMTWRLQRSSWREVSDRIFHGCLFTLTPPSKHAQDEWVA